MEHMKQGMLFVSWILMCNIGCRYIADIVIGFLQDMAAYVAQTYAESHHELHPEVHEDILPPPLFPGNAGDKPESCFFDDSFAALVTDSEVSTSQHLLSFALVACSQYQCTILKYMCCVPIMCLKGCGHILSAESQLPARNSPPGVVWQSFAASMEYSEQVGLLLGLGLGGRGSQA